MELQDELDIEIFHTLEQLKRMNEAIHRHGGGDESSQFMTEQFLEMKQRLTRELQDLMSRATEVTWLVAA
ncbi:MAG: hypothetical protein EAZ91_11830 [Cytophagales bacterium]|nr:MAG: hypothetical protein EAZ91_11830 [Cytophagales bacterium]